MFYKNFLNNDRRATKNCDERDENKITVEKVVQSQKEKIW